MRYNCSRCGINTEYLTDIKRHMNKKKTCDPILNSSDPTIICSEIKVECDHCKKNFFNTDSMKRHLKTCKIKKINLEEENKKLKEELLVARALAKKPNTTINNQTNNNVIINLAPWNDPKLPADVEKYYREAVKKIFLAVPTLIKSIHFNADFPENHNICIKNGRSKTAKVYNGKEWETVDEDQLIRTLINDYEHTLEYYAEDKNPKYLKQIQEIKDRDTEEKVYDDLHTEVKRVIYDRNHMVKIKN